MPPGVFLGLWVLLNPPSPPPPRHFLGLGVLAYLKLYPFFMCSIVSKISNINFEEKCLKIKKEKPYQVSKYNFLHQSYKIFEIDLVFAFFKFPLPNKKSGNMFYKKSVLIRLKIKTICLTKEIFEMIIKITVFLINSNDQELIHHIHCFWYTFCHHNKTIKFGWF